MAFQNLVITLQLGLLGLHRRHLLGLVPQGLERGHLVLQPAGQADDPGLHLHQPHLDLLVQRVEHAGGAGADRLFFAALLAFQLIDERLLLLLVFGIERLQLALGIDHVRMLVGEAAQRQGIHLAFQLGDARGQVGQRRPGPEGGRPARAAQHRTDLAGDGDERGLVFQLHAQGIPDARGLRQFGFGGGHLIARGLDAADVGGVAGQNVGVPALEFGLEALGLVQLPFVVGDLLVDEAAGAGQILAVGAQIGLHEDGQQVLDHPLGHLPVFVVGQVGVTGLIADLEQVQTLVGDGDVAFQVLDHQLQLLGGLGIQVHVGAADHLLHVGPADQRATHDVDLLHDVDVDGDAAHQRAQHGLGVHIDARRRPEAVGNGRHRDPPQQADHVSRGQRIPPFAPDVVDQRQYGAIDFMHLRSPDPVGRAQRRVALRRRPSTHPVGALKACYLCNCLAIARPLV